MGTEHTQIVAYQDWHADAFAKLNREWLDRFGLYEKADDKHLYSPAEFILDPGGKIFIAEKQGLVVGTCALIPVSEAVFEIAKLVVSTESRREGLGRRLAQHALAFARDQGAAKVVLISNHQLKPALKLYKSLRFKNRPLPKGLPYKTADIYMELEMAETHSDVVPKGA